MDTSKIMTQINILEITQKKVSCKNKQLMYDNNDNTRRLLTNQWDTLHAVLTLHIRKLCAENSV